MHHLPLCLLLLTLASGRALFLPFPWLSGQCSPFNAPPIDLVDPIDSYEIPCIPKGKSGKPIRIGRKMHYSFDFVIIGAGSAGSTVASRLSEDGRYTVLLLETGLPERRTTDMPVNAATLARSSYDWQYQNEPVEGKFSAFKNGSILSSRGKGIGGSSIINFMIYTRGHKLDWDRICAKGNPGWDWNHILPYFKKSEKADLGPIGENSEVHNKNGMLSIQFPSYRSRLAKIFMDAANELGQRVDEYNDGNARGFSYVQTHTKGGHRNSVARAYLYPFIKTRPNLDIFYNCTVTKIHIIHKMANYVSYVHEGKTYTAYARKEIILSAGAIASPQILILSGVGPANHLRDIGIPLVHDLKVGETLYDHPMYIGLVPTLNETGLTFKGTDFTKYALEWLLFGTSPITMAGGIEALGYIKTNVSDDAEDIPDIEYLFGSISAGKYHAISHNLDDEYVRNIYGELNDTPNFFFNPMLLHPKSKGSITLRDKNYLSHPKINYDFLSEEHDIETLVEGIMYAIKVLKTNAFQKVGAKLHDKRLPQCSGEEFGSRAYWRCAVLATTMPNRHPMGTCKMGPFSDPEAVVDAQLRVHGIRNLRVCDASIFPIAMTGHLNAPTVVVGEKCADLIKLTYE